VKNKWEKIWNKRKINNSPKDPLRVLIEADGFNTNAGAISTADWLSYNKWIYEKIEVKSKYSLYDVGCGAGAFLYPFYIKGHIVGGIDYAKRSIQLAKSIMPKMNFEQNEALKLNTNIKYDVVFSNSVFQYFDDYSYAENVIIKMVMKAKKNIVILDINDIAKKNIAFEIRKKSFKGKNYSNHYKGLEHLYYDKLFFKNIAKSLDCRIDIFSQRINNYKNNTFRYNVIMSKNKI